MTPAEPLAADRLAELRSVRYQLEAAERLTLAVRAYRDRLVVELARMGAPQPDIAEAAGIRQQSISKIARGRGERRYRPRSAGDA